MTNRRRRDPKEYPILDGYAELRITTMSAKDKPLEVKVLRYDSAVLVVEHEDGTVEVMPWVIGPRLFYPHGDPILPFGSMDSKEEEAVP